LGPGNGAVGVDVSGDDYTFQADTDDVFQFTTLKASGVMRVMEWGKGAVQVSEEGSSSSRGSGGGGGGGGRTVSYRCHH